MEQVSNDKDIRKMETISLLRKRQLKFPVNRTIANSNENSHTLLADVTEKFYHNKYKSKMEMLKKATSDISRQSPVSWNVLPAPVRVTPFE